MMGYMWELIFKLDALDADGVHLMLFFLTQYSMWTCSVIRCITAVWHRNPIPPAVLHPQTPYQ